MTLPPDGRARIAVVSDTHSAPHPEARARVAAMSPVAILHAGDIGDLSVLTPFAALAPLFAVRGNIDTHAPDVPDAMVIDLLRAGGASVAVRIYLTHVAVYGPKLRADVGRAARAEQASLVVCGHSHVPFLSRDRELGVFNPGSIGPRRFRLPIAFGAIDVAPDAVVLTHFDCETGERWRPAAPPSITSPGRLRDRG